MSNPNPRHFTAEEATDVAVAAISTLKKAGYTYNPGAELWRPPLGPAPNMTLAVLDTKPLLYTDTIKGEQTCRDDLWVIDSATVKAVRALVAQLETRCDPSGEVRHNRQLMDVNQELAVSNRQLRDRVAELERLDAGQIVDHPASIVVLFERLGQTA